MERCTPLHEVLLALTAHMEGCRLPHMVVLGSYVPKHPVAAWVLQVTHCYTGGLLLLLASHTLPACSAKNIHSYTLYRLQTCELTLVPNCSHALCYTKCEIACTKARVVAQCIFYHKSHA